MKILVLGPQKPTKTEQPHKNMGKQSKKQHCVVLCVFARTLQCAPKHVNCNTKPHFYVGATPFIRCGVQQNIAKTKKITFCVLRLLLTVVQKDVKLFAHGNNILAISTLLGVCGGAIHLQSGALSHYIGNKS